MNFYINNFNFRQPYQLLIDGTFCVAALNNKINIADNMPRYLQGELKLLTTPCAIVEMEKLGPKVFGALKILKNFALHKCCHDKRPVPAVDCLLSMVKNYNEKHYVVATQDRDLQGKIRRLPGVPLLYLHQKAPVLDPPTEVSLKFANDRVVSKFTIPATEKKVLDELRGRDEEKKVKKRKVKGPNPLSCKKKKNKSSGGTLPLKEEKDVERKKRKKIRIAQHVKEELSKK